eukprot:3353122-Lingulodinium_polyedra.AAC.1
MLDEYVCVPKPPSGTAPEGYGWQLAKALYGTRRASQLWAEFLAELYLSHGWTRCMGVPNVYWHPELDCVS